ncbi:MAG: enoyl-CoA hydratase [Solirubrobacteraceae bacterium]|jgi:enoyl-CoA hydratase|nr:enoyl-CoA hydratase [Solirubrobacteraceae bacterium]MEA2279238.1 enoyl-CoA hydratase [Solirubrobacteraceae bacterium]MEA2357039.1 enoyl-CoA hydratase [Solirubrobacteraceae bacterium]MEA2396121.1 enoyl-CoA hydratase [Solirubrobacteraceae bacterium]
MDDARYRCLDVRRDGDVLRVVIDHPDSEINAVDAELHHELTALFAALKRETTARAVLLSGRGKAFSAGGSFDWFKELSSPRAVFDLQRDARQMIWDMLEVELPIVTAVHGYAMGLAANLALLSDVIFLGESAKIADPHVRAGIVAGDGGVVIWPMAIGPARAKEYLLTGDPLTAEEAHRIGLANRVVPDAELEDAAFAFAQRLAAGAPMAVRYTKLAINKLIKDALNTAFDASTGYEMVTMLSEDHDEAVAAFKEKRTPRFEGR